MDLEVRNKIKHFNVFTPDCEQLPDVKPSHSHTVAFHVIDKFRPGIDTLEPYYQDFVPKWDDDYVPMPCCEQNVKKFAKLGEDKNKQNEDDPTDQENKNERKYIKYFVWERIKDALEKPILCVQDIESTMKNCFSIRKNSNINALKMTLEDIMTRDEREDFFSTVLPVIINLCLNVDKIVTSPIPLLTRFKRHSITLTQKQIACLLSLAFFSFFPKILRNAYFPTINFNTLFFGYLDDTDLIKKAQKIRCLLNYFKRISVEMPQGAVTYTKKSLLNSQFPEWKSSTKLIRNLVPTLNGTIESDGIGMLQIDFANKIVGGGVLGDGCVQEEILFLIYPELLICRLFTERLTACEAMAVTGCERFSQYKGYASSFEYDGDFIDTVLYDKYGRKYTQFIVIDALYWDYDNSLAQFHPKNITRELDKAYVGFSAGTPFISIATGKWGCGAFNGDPQLKTVIQLMAASELDRDVLFFTFDDQALAKDIEIIIGHFKNYTIKQVWKILCQYYSLFCYKGNPSYSLAQFIEEYVSSTTAADNDEEEDEDEDKLDKDKEEKMEIEDYDDEEGSNASKNKYKKEFSPAPYSPTASTSTVSKEANERYDKDFASLNTSLKFKKSKNDDHQQKEENDDKYLLKRMNEMKKSWTNKDDKKLEINQNNNNGKNSDHVITIDDDDEEKKKEIITIDDNDEEKKKDIRITDSQETVFEECSSSLDFFNSLSQSKDDEVQIIPTPNTPKSISTTTTPKTNIKDSPKTSSKKREGKLIDFYS